LTNFHISAGRKEALRVVGEHIAPLDQAWGQPEQATARKARPGLADLPADVFERP
jgi:hypothetical protein